MRIRHQLRLPWLLPRVQFFKVVWRLGIRHVETSQCPFQEHQLGKSYWEAIQNPSRLRGKITTSKQTSFHISAHITIITTTIILLSSLIIILINIILNSYLSLLSLLLSLLLSSLIITVCLPESLYLTHCLSIFFGQAPVNKLVPMTSLLWALYKSRVYDYDTITINNW